MIGGLALAPFLLKGRVVELVEKALNERLEATVSFEDVALSVLSTFPALGVEVVGLEVVGAGAFEGVTLASVQSFRAEVDLVRLVRHEQLLIESATIDQPAIYLLVDEDGSTNYDIVKATDEERAEDEPAALALRLQQYQITGGRIEYEAPGTKVSVHGIEQGGYAAIDGDTYTVASSTTVESLTLQVGGVGYIEKAGANLDLSAVLRADEERLEVERFEITLNELSGNGSGEIEWGDEAVDVDLGLASGKGQSLRALVSAIPNAYAGDLAGLQGAGTYSLGAKVKGRLGGPKDHAPSFSAYLFVRNGALKHPRRPLSLTGIELDAKLKHPGGHLDKMTIEVSSYTARAGQSHIEGRFAVATPISKPAIALVGDGRIDLAEVAKAYPLTDSAYLRGTIAAQLDLAAEGEHVERLTGWIVATAVAYRPKDAPNLEVSAASVKLGPKATEVTSLTGAYGQSDLLFKGSLSPLIVLFRGKERFAGNLQLESRAIYLDEILEGESVEIPKKLDITIAAQAKKLMRKQLVLSDMRGIVSIKDGEVTLSDVRSDAGRKHVDDLVSSLKHDPIVGFRALPQSPSRLFER